LELNIKLIIIERITNTASSVEVEATLPPTRPALVLVRGLKVVVYL
jgi:hypothetical protein